MSYYQQFLGGTSIYPIIINNNAQAGIQPALRLQNTNSGTIAQRIDMWNSNVSGKPTWTLISDYMQGGTNDLRFISAATDSTGVGVMTLLQNGNVGIGTMNPAYRLHIENSTTESAFAVGNNFLVNSNVISGNSSTYICTITTWGSDTTYNGLKVTGKSWFNGNVGIGTNNPSAPLHITNYNAGGVSIGVNTGNAISFDANNSNTNQIGTFNIYGTGAKLTLLGGANGGQLTTYNGGWNQVLTWTSGGYIGIGITNPSYPLQVIGSVNVGTNGNNGYIYPSSGGTQSVDTSYINSVTAAFSTYISSWGVIAVSDIRIKNNIVETDTTMILNKILQMPLMTYNYIDTVHYTNDIEHGVIAQTVKNIFPEAVNLEKGYIPSVYTIASSVTLSDDTTNIIITITIPTTSELKVGGNVRMHIENMDKEYITTVVSFTSTQIVVPKWEEFDDTKKVFVYGAEVDDYHKIDKAYLALISMGGIQELSKRNDSLTNKVTTLQTNNDELTTQVTTLQTNNEVLTTQVTTLQTNNDELTNKVTTLQTNNEVLTTQVTNQQQTITEMQQQITLLMQQMASLLQK